MWFPLLIVVFAFLFYILRRHYSYWKIRGVRGPQPLYFLGNIASFFLQDKSFVEVYADIYRKYKDYPVVGIYRLLTPCLIIRDPELIKDMSIRNFKNFQDNDVLLNEKRDHVFGRDPFYLRGAEWKAKRAQLTSCFTSGKLKSMYPLIEEVAARMLSHMDRKISTTGNAVTEIKEVCKRYTIENVAACMFGLKGECFEEENPIFKKLADNFPAPGKWQHVISTLIFSLPPLAKLMRLRRIDDEVDRQLTELVKGAMDGRRSNKIVKNDILEHVYKFVEESRSFEDVQEIVSIIANFFGDGFDLTSKAMTLTIFELAIQQECQNKLRAEINEQLKATSRKIDYETLQNMTYLDACINESLRKYPIFGKILKMCTQRFTFTCNYPDNTEQIVTIEPGTSIIYPIIALQNDEKYFESPEKYMPERFLNRSEFQKDCYMPFGEGPRMCLGSRFALLQLKIGIANLISKFEFSVNSKTRVPLKFEKWSESISPIGGVWLNVKRIEDN